MAALAISSWAFLLPSLLWGQEITPPEYGVKSWTTEDGLPQNTVQAIAQTPDGYLWLGTRGGVARFDGVRFEIYGLAEGLKSVDASELTEDGEGGLWIATEGGGLSHLKDGRIATYTTAEGLADNVVLAVAADSGGRAWVGGPKGLQYFDGTRFTAMEGAPVAEIRALVPGRDGVLWVSTLEEGLFQMKNGKFQPLPGPKGEKFISPWLLPDRKGGLWVSLGNARVFHHSADGWTIYDFAHGVPVSTVQRLAEGADGEVWLGSMEEGLHFFRDGRFHPASIRSKVALNPSIRSLHSTRDGILWVGTQSGGLSRLTRQEIHGYPVDQAGHRGSVGAIVEEAEGTYLVPTWGGGLYRGTLDRLQLQEHVPALRDNPFLVGGLPLRGGQSCVFGFNLLLKTSIGSSDFLNIPTDQTWFTGWETPRGELLLGSLRGELHRLDGDTTKIVPNGQFSAAIRALASGPEGEVWVATAGAGLYRWQAGQTQHWGTGQGLPTEMLQALHRDASGTLWIGTGGGGLAWLRDGKIHCVDRSKGLADNFITEILEDHRGDLWLAGHRGISRIPKRELEEVAAGRAAAVHPLALDESDGMPSPGCSSGMRTKLGHLLFATPRGIAEVDPTRFGEFPPPPAARIEGVTIDGRGPTASQPSVEVLPGQREVEFRFTAFNYLDPEDIRFRYRLVDRDSGWTEIGTQRSARFSLLPPGSYTFQVSAANIDGHWSEPTPGFVFTVQPYYWQTAWFRAAAVFLLIGLGGGLAAWRARFQLLRAEERERLARAEAEAQQHLNEVAHLTRVSTLGELSSALAHELNQPLAAILGNAQVGSRDLQGGSPDLPEIAAIFDDITTDAKRAGGIIHGMRAMFRKDNVTEAQPLDLNDAVNQTMRLLHSEIVGRKVAVDLQLGENLPLVQAGRVEIQQVLINLVLNGLDAMNYSGPGARLTISTSHRNGQVELQVQDNGPGIPPEMLERLFEPFASSKQNGLGLGLAISRSIAERFLGRLLAENPPHGGALFRLILPTSAN